MNQIWSFNIQICTYIVNIRIRWSYFFVLPIYHLRNQFVFRWKQLMIFALWFLNILSALLCSCFEVCVVLPWNVLLTWKVTLSCIVLQSGQTYLKKSWGFNTARFLKYVRPFCNSKHKNININKKTNFLNFIADKILGDGSF